MMKIIKFFLLSVCLIWQLNLFVAEGGMGHEIPHDGTLEIRHQDHSVEHSVVHQEHSVSLPTHLNPASTKIHSVTTSQGQGFQGGSVVADPINDLPKKNDPTETLDANRALGNVAGSLPLVNPVRQRAPKTIMEQAQDLDKKITDLSKEFEKLKTDTSKTKEQKEALIKLSKQAKKAYQTIHDLIKKSIQENTQNVDPDYDLIMIQSYESIALRLSTRILEELYTYPKVYPVTQNTLQRAPSTESMNSVGSDNSEYHDTQLPDDTSLKPQESHRDEQPEWNLEDFPEDTQNQGLVLSEEVLKKEESSPFMQKIKEAGKKIIDSFLKIFGTKKQKIRILSVEYNALDKDAIKAIALKNRIKFLQESVQNNFEKSIQSLIRSKVSKKDSQLFTQMYQVDRVIVENKNLIKGIIENDQFQDDSFNVNKAMNTISDRLNVMLILYKGIEKNIKLEMKKSPEKTKQQVIADLLNADTSNLARYKDLNEFIQQFNQEQNPEASIGLVEKKIQELGMQRFGDGKIKSIETESLRRFDVYQMQVLILNVINKEG